MEQPVREATSGTATCAVATCDRAAGRHEGDKPRATDVLCIAHRRRLRKSKPGTKLASFTKAQAGASPILEPRGEPGRKPHFPPIDFSIVHPHLQEELRYIAAIKILRNRWRNPRYANEVLRQTLDIGAANGHRSLDEFLDPGGLQTQRRKAIGFPAPMASAFPSMLDTLREASSDPWAAYYWHPTVLGMRTNTSTMTPIRWHAVTCEWLRKALMQLAREDLQSGARAWSTVRGYVRVGNLLSAYMSEVGHIQPQDLTRACFLDFLSWVRNEDSKGADIVAVNVAAHLLMRMQEGGMVPDLPETSFLLRGENPTTRVRQPRPFPADILAAVDDLITSEEFLEPDTRLLLRIFRAVGPRASEALSLPIDCIRHTKRGYSLEYFQSKVQDWRRVPLPPRLGADLAAQAAWVTDQHGDGCKWLFPYEGPAPRENHLGQSKEVLGPWPYGRFSSTVWAAYKRAEIRHSSLTGETLKGPQLHRFRHSVATGLLNEGWSQYEVQKFLGHKSPTMMQAYAEIHEDTLRTKYIEFVEKSIDATGTKRDLNIEGSADIERLRDRMIRTTLPNGYCTLPEKQTCDFVPTPCLSCTAFFRTTPTFLPIHIRQRDESLREIEVAREDGRERSVRAHEQTVKALNRIIAGLEDVEEESNGANG